MSHSYSSVNDVLTTHWDGSLPVDPKLIAQKMGVDVRPFPDDIYANHVQGEHQDAGLSGKLDFEDGLPVCFYNREDPPVRIRFTIAHELGHFVHGHGKSFRDDVKNFSASKYDINEIQANRFAASLLMPEEAVHSAVRQLGISDIGRLSDTFNVSQAAMKFRLKNLGIIR